jgi:hypothetical protein
MSDRRIEPGDLGLADDRRTVVMHHGDGLHAPGDVLEFRLIQVEGTALIQRRFVLSLFAEGTAVARDQRFVETLEEDEQVLLTVTLPPRAPAQYVLELAVEGGDEQVRRWRFGISVPEQGVDAALSVTPQAVAAGGALVVTLRNEGPTGISTGRAIELWRLDPGGSVRLAPLGGTKLPRIRVPRGSERSQSVRVPADLAPGRYRLVKQLHAEVAGVLWATLSCELEVTP